MRNHESCLSRSLYTKQGQDRDGWKEMKEPIVPVLFPDCFLRIWPCLCNPVNECRFLCFPGKSVFT